MTGWLNRNVLGMAITSFFADVGYEMVSAVLPGFLASIGVAAAALGWIEGVADAVSSFVKLGSGWYGDRVGHRKPIVAIGYFLSGTALSVFALAVSWPLVLAGRMVAWFGKGIRGPLRDAMLSESSPPEVRGKVFGMHRASDTAGAVMGPLFGAWLLTRLPHPTASAPFRTIFLVSLVPGLISFFAMVFIVKERRGVPNPRHKFWKSVRAMPRAYRRFLMAVALFGSGDFAPTLLILAVAQLRGAELGALLYVVRNLVYALAAFPAGALADRMNQAKLLAVGYGLGALTAFSAAHCFFWHISSTAALTGVFVLAGLCMAIQDTLEGSIPAGLIVASERGTAYGILGAVNGVGDLIASGLVGTLWTLVSPVAGFVAAGVLMASGAVALAAGQKGT